MPKFKKHFTLEEARATLPLLRKILQDGRRCQQRIQQATEKMQESLDRTGGDSGGVLVNRTLRDLLHLNGQVRRIQQMGIQIKDFDRGLVDFPHLRDGQEVFLCWELEEDDIEFWHDLDTGYAGRERL